MKKKKKKYKYRETFIGEDGKRHDVKADSVKELGAKRAVLEMKIHRDIRTVSGTMTLREWADRCISAYKTNQCEVTRKKYCNRVNHCILEEIGSLRVRDIRPIDCQEVLNQQVGKSKTQINEVYQALRFLFRHAVAENLIAHDPTLNLTKPKAAKPNPRRALTPYERQMVIQVALTDRRYYLYLLMLLCGCRPSEAAECKSSDIIWRDNTVLLHIRGTKTAKADREVPLPEPLKSIALKIPPGEYIAQTKAGHKLLLSARRRVWDSFKRRLNIAMGCRTYRNKLIPPFPVADDLVPYDFRHEYCTNLARKGIDICKAQILMGHSDISLTANVYTNLDTTQVAVDAARILENVETDVETTG